MAATSRTRNHEVTRTLFAGLPRRYDELAAVLSLGQDRRWRTAMLDHVAPDHPDLVLDVATGPAGVARELAGRTGGRVIGIDLSEPMLRRGVAEVEHAGLDGRIVLLAGQAEQLPFPDAAFGGLTFTYLLRYVEDPAATLARAGAGAAARRADGQSGVRRAAPLVVAGAGGAYTRLVLPVAGLTRAVERGSTSDASSARASPRTTSATRCRGPSRRGSRPGSSTSAPDP